MNKVRDTVAAYLRDLGTFQARQIVRQTGLSRQVVNRQLRRMVVANELVRTGMRRGVRYMAGPGSHLIWEGTARGARRFDTWSELAKAFADFGYIRLSLHGAQLLTRQQARNAVAGLEFRRFLVLDFEDIERATEAFLDELFERHLQPQPINASPSIRAALERVRLLREMNVPAHPED